MAKSKEVQFIRSHRHRKLYFNIFKTNSIDSCQANSCSELSAKNVIRFASYSGQIYT